MGKKETRNIPLNGRTQVRPPIQSNKKKHFHKGNALSGKQRISDRAGNVETSWKMLNLSKGHLQTQAIFREKGESPST